MAAVTYDAHGRMKYHPDFHPNQGKQWMMSDQKHLIENYERIGPEQMSLELGRTIHTIMNKAYELRKAGLMKKRTLGKNHKRHCRPS